MTSLLDPPDIVHTGPDTLAGRYLRMFWQPVYRAEDLAPAQMRPIQIMSEKFTLYRGGEWDSPRGGLPVRPSRDSAVHGLGGGGLCTVPLSWVEIRRLGTMRGAAG